MESADVRGPPGNARQSHVQSSGKLAAHTPEAGRDIPGPHQRPVPLTPSPGAAEQIHDLLLPLLHTFFATLSSGHSNFVYIFYGKILHKKYIRGIVCKVK